MQTALLTLFLPVAYALVTPVATWGHKCVRANRSIYCLGGLQEGPVISTNMYHLDISATWDTASPPWIQVSTDNVTSNGFGIHSAFAGVATLSDHSNILVNGGATSANMMEISNGTALFDTRTDTWTVPALTDRSLRQSRYYHSLVSDGQGRIWIWGGQDNQQYFNTWTVIDTAAWTISYPEIANPPVPRIQHTATLVGSGKIIIIGGLTYSRNVTDPLGGQSLNPVSMADILLFEMATAKWSYLTAGGNIPAPRREHTAVLSRDSSSIIVFGGGDPRYNDVNMNDIFVLNLTSLLWSSPSISNEPPPPRKSHEAILVTDLMLVMFGYNNQGQGYSDVHVLDTASWSWITKYDPNEGSKDTESMGSASGANKTLPTTSQTDVATKALFGSLIIASLLAVIGLCCVVGNIIANHRSKSREQNSKACYDIPHDNFLDGIREIIQMGTINSRHHLSSTPQKPDIEEEDISSQKPNELDGRN